MDTEYKTCLRCGRKLKTEESKSLGYGKICWLRYLESKKCKKLFEIEVNEDAQQQ